MKIDVSHVAKLANLPLTDSEKKKLEEQLEETLIHIQNLQEIDTKNTPPTDHVTKLENVLRDDEAKPSLSQEQALQNGKSVQKGLFKVPAILEDN